jgi:hypothetical protein
MIEGVQEFVLIVGRPRGMEGLSVEARLETGHFPEKVQIKRDPPEYEEEFQLWPVRYMMKEASDEWEEFGPFQWTPPQGYVIDRRKGHWSTPGVEVVWTDAHQYVNNPPDPTAGPNMMIAEDAAEDHFIVSGQIRGKGFWPRDIDDFRAWFHTIHRIHYRSVQPTRTFPPEVETDFLITSRGLMASIKSGERCVERAPSASITRELAQLYRESIVDEMAMTLGPVTSVERDGNAGPTLSNVKELIGKIQRAMSTSAQRLQRSPYGEKGFLESDYFKREVARFQPPPSPPVTEGQID